MIKLFVSKPTCVMTSDNKHKWNKIKNATKIMNFINSNNGNNH